MNKERINELGRSLCDVGRELPDEITLDDLFNYHQDAGLAAGNSPSSWLSAIDRLGPKEKQILSNIIGIANRCISRRENADANLWHIRNTNITFLANTPSKGHKGITKEGVNLLLEIFKKS